MSMIPLSFSEWSYFYGGARRNLSSWGQCGLIASANGGVLTIYKYDGRQFTIYLSWTPFQNADITAMGWYDGSLGATISRPIIAVSFLSPYAIILY